MNLFSTEQVSKYHPDKFADQISDALVGLALSKQPNARCAIETLVKNDTVVIAGEIGGIVLDDKDIEKTIKEVANDLNYKVNNIVNLLDTQSLEISQAVVKNSGEIGAGDQGFMVGYATRETETYLPKAFDLANKIIEAIEIEAEKWGILKGDAKTQVVIDLDTNKVKKVLVSVCHDDDVDLDLVIKRVQFILKPLVDKRKLLINPAGAWTVGGSFADSGLTGRKIVADQYGGFTPVGGGAFSGKDLTKVDRSGAYVARNIAIDVLKRFEKLKWVEIQLGYAIGVARPLSVNIKSSDSAFNKKIKTFINKNYDLRPKKMIERLNLKPSDYVKLAGGCHFKNGYVGEWL